MMRIPLVILIAGGLLLFVAGAPAMNRWSALSMIESGDDDRAVGPRGEVSRFQIRPELWPAGNSQNERDALAAAQEVMKPRLEAFEKSHGRPATDFEFYVLWNAPWQLDHPSNAVTERARRFSNLVRR
ncbi:MAG TPA: hypothetical protein VF480_11185 [Verrucomicrobiae bacterium]